VLWVGQTGHVVVAATVPPVHAEVDAVQELAAVDPPSHHWHLAGDAKQELQPFADSKAHRQLEAVTLVTPPPVHVVAPWQVAAPTPGWQYVQLYEDVKHVEQS